MQVNPPNLNFKKKGIWFLSLLLIWSLFQWDVLFAGKSFLRRTLHYTGVCDALLDSEMVSSGGPRGIVADPLTSVIYNEPLHGWIAQQIQQGNFPLYHPHLALGHDVLSRIQIGAYFPLHWLYYLFPSSRMMDWIYVLKILVALVGFFLFLVSGLGMGRGQALLGALFWSQTSFFVARVNLNISTVLMVAPFYWWAILAFHRSPACFSTVSALGLSAALVLLAGFPETSLAVYYLGLGFHLYGWSIDPSNKRTCASLVKGLLGALLLALSISAIQWLPLFEVLGRLEPSQVERKLDYFWSLKDFLHSFLFLPVGFPPVLHPGGLGIVGFYLALVGAFTLKGKRRMWVAVCLLFYGVGALGGEKFGAIKDLFPFIQTVRFSRDFAVFLWLPLCFLMAMAFEKTHHRERMWKAHIQATFVTLVTLGLYFYLQRHSLEALSFSRPALWNLVGLAVMGGVLGHGVLQCKKDPQNLLSLGLLNKKIGLVALGVLFCQIPRQKPPFEKMPFEQEVILKSTLSPPVRQLQLGSLSFCSAQSFATSNMAMLQTAEPLMDRRYGCWMKQWFKCTSPDCLGKIEKTKHALLGARLSSIEHVVFFKNQASEVGELYPSTPLPFEDKRSQRIERLKVKSPHPAIEWSCGLKTYRTFEEGVGALKEGQEGFWALDNEMRGITKSYCETSPQHARPQAYQAVYPSRGKSFLTVQGPFEPGYLKFTHLYQPWIKAYGPQGELPTFPLWSTFMGVDIQETTPWVELRYENSRWFAAALWSGVTLLVLLGGAGMVFIKKRISPQVRDLHPT